jgi:hypothetical protein
MRPTDVIQRSPRRVFNSERLGARNRSVLVPSNEPDAARTASGPPWSAVEYTSTHPLDVRLRRALHDGNEVVSRCGTPELNGPRRPVIAFVVEILRSVHGTSWQGIGPRRSP